MSGLEVHDKIVRRQREVNDVVSLWKQICQGNTKITFREFYGIPGIGKTELARQIKITLGSEGASCAKLDFDPVQNPWGSEPRNEKVLLYYDQPENLFRELLTEWNYLDDPDLQNELPLDSGESTFEPQHFAQQIVNRIKSLAPVLICDETDHIQWERLSWFVGMITTVNAKPMVVSQKL